MVSWLFLGHIRFAPTLQLLFPHGRLFSTIYWRAIPHTHLYLCLIYLISENFITILFKISIFVYTAILLPYPLLPLSSNTLLYILV